MTLEVRKVFKIKKRVVRKRGKLLEATIFLASTRGIFSSAARPNLMLNNDRACVRDCEMIPFAIDTFGMHLISWARVIFLSSESTEEASRFDIFTVAIDGQFYNKHNKSWIFGIYASTLYKVLNKLLREWLSCEFYTDCSQGRVSGLAVDCHASV